MKGTVRLIVILLLTLVFAGEVRADYRLFIPRISEYQGFATLDSSYEQQEDTTNGRGLKNKDLFLRETLQLNSVGYVYDPRFITFQVNLSAGVKQESFSIGDNSEPFNTMFAREYTFRMIVLPKHPYNLELFALRVEPLTRRAFLQSESVAYSKGAIFRYKKKPYFFNAHYIDNTTESPVGSYSTTKYGVLGTYYKEMGQEKFYSYSGTYDHTTSSYSAGGSTDTAALANTYYLKTISISSNVAYTQSSQDSSSLSLSSKTMNWGERARLRLPWNFTWDLSFGWNKNKLKTSSGAAGEQKISSTTKSISTMITHKLYSSLFSNYSLSYSSLDSGTGTTTTFANSLGFTYVKNIPWGRMRSGISLGRTTTDRKGVQSVPNEPHPGVRVPGSFTLDNQDVDVNTILVFVGSVEVPGQVILLTENVDYVVTPFGNTFQITVLNLPPEFVIPGTYDFFVSYTLNNAESKIRTTNLSYSLNFELFNDLLFPYYNHTTSRQKVLSGTTQELPWNFTSDIVGFMLVKRPFTFSASYLKVSSDVNPSSGWKTELTYIDNLSQTMQLQAAANYSDISYPEGSGTGGVSYTERVFGASAGIQQTFTRQNMHVSVVGAYSRAESFTTSNSYSLSGNYVWNVGKIDLTAGATGSLSDNEFQGGKNRRVYQYYYLSVKRRLF